MQVCCFVLPQTCLRSLRVCSRASRMCTSRCPTSTTNGMCGHAFAMIALTFETLGVVCVSSKGLLRIVAGVQGIES